MSAELNQADSNYMDLDEASVYSRLSRKTLCRLEHAGLLAFLRPSPRRVIVQRQTLDAYLQGSATKK
jgi:hypothetical protein